MHKKLSLIVSVINQYWIIILKKWKTKQRNKKSNKQLKIAKGLPLTSARREVKH